MRMLSNKLCELHMANANFLWGDVRSHQRYLCIDTILYCPFSPGNPPQIADTNSNRTYVANRESIKVQYILEQKYTM